MSSGVAQRRSGVCASICSTTPGIALLRAQSAVSTTPGATAFTRIPAGPELHRERAGGGVDRALRRRVGGTPRRTHEPRHRGQVDDRTAATLDHRRQQRRDEEQRGAHVHREQRVDRCRIEVDGGQPGRGGRVVHEDVDAVRARRVQRARDASVLPRRRARRAARRGRGADPPATVSSCSQVASRERDACAGPSSAAGDRGADAA